jgi:hypothetical protein
MGTIDFDYFLRVNSFLFPRKGKIIKKKELYRLRDEYNKWLEGSRHFLEECPSPVSIDINKIPAIDFSQPIGKFFFSNLII